MDASLPGAVPVPCKSRRGWLIAFGVIEILLGCGFLLMIALSAFVFLGPAVSKMPANSMPAGPFSRLAIMAMVGLQYGALAVVFFAGGIGSIRCKNWARILMLVVSGLWIAFGLIATLGMAFMFPMIMRQQPSKISCEQQHAMIVGMITFMAVLGVLVPAVFLFFYTRKGVKATCLALKGTEVMARGTAQEFSPPGLPIPLGIMGAWEALSALAVLATLFVRVTFMFGVVLHGATAVLVLLTYSILSGVAAWFIFRQKVIGWRITFSRLCFGPSR